MCEKITKEVKSRKDGIKLSVLLVKPKEGAALRGIVQVVHGMSEYKERYLPFMEYLAEQGFVTVIHDHRGHGKSVISQKDLGYMYGGGAEAFLDDILLVQRLVKREYKDLPVILFGHSMGSLAVRAFARKQDDRLDALLVCGSPSKNPARAVGTVLAQAELLLQGPRHKSRLIEAMSFGSFASKFKGEKSRFAWVCADPEVVEAYEASPLCGFTFTDDAYLVLFDLMKQAYASKGWKCSKPDLPILFVGGAEDPCIGGPRKFAQALNAMRMAGYHNVKGKLYPGMRHEILNEKDKYQVFQDIDAFLRQKGL